MNQLEGQVGMFDPDSVFGRMFQEPCLPTAEKTSGSCLKNSAASKTQELQYLNLTGGGGTLLGALWETVTALPGASWTPNSGECPSVAVESHLWQILQDNPPRKYCLSARAAQGVLNRAERRGKKLPELLREALTEAVRIGNGDERFDPDEDAIDAAADRLSESLG